MWLEVMHIEFLYVVQCCTPSVGMPGLDGFVRIRTSHGILHWTFSDASFLTRFLSLGRGAWIVVYTSGILREWMMPQEACFKYLQYFFSGLALKRGCIALPPCGTVPVGPGTG